MSQEYHRYQAWLGQQQQALSAHERLTRVLVVGRESIYGAGLASYHDMLQVPGVDLLKSLNDKRISTPGLRVLDAGAGPGYAAEDIKRTIPSAQVFALDAQDYPKARAARRTQSLPEITRIRGSYFDTKRLLAQEGVGDGVDVILCMRAFFPQLLDKSALSSIAQANLLEEFSSCLRPRGLAFVTMEMNQENLREMNSFQERLTKRGFSLSFEEMDQNKQEKFTITPVTSGGRMMVAVLQRN